MGAIILINKQHTIAHTWITWAAFYFAAILINTIYSESFSITLSFLWNTITHVLIALFFVFSIKTKYDYYNIIRAFMYIGVFVSVFVLFRERTTMLFLPLGTETFGGGNIPFTYILLPASMSCIFLLIVDRKKHYFPIIFFLFVVSLLTTSRKAIFLPIVFFLIFNFFYAKNFIFRNIKFILLGSILMGGVLFVFFNNQELSQMSFDRLDSLFSFFSEGEGDESLERREDLITKGLLYIAERPLLGYGMGTYSYVTHSEVYSHNNYIETLFGGGVVMLIIYYSINIINVVRLWKSKNEVSAFLLSISIIYLISDFGTVSYYVFPQLFMTIMASVVGEMNDKKLIKSKIAV
jgi:O-antigen ligase